VVSSWGDPLEDPDAFLTRMEAYAALGIEQVWVQPNAADPAGSVERYGAELVPRLAEVG
jgi:hypothetical protein